MNCSSARLFHLLILTIVISFLRCKKTESIVLEKGPTGEAGENGNGSAGIFKGKVNIITENFLFGDFKSASVTIKGTAFQTGCDSLGNFIFSDVPPGIYDIVYKAPKCGEIQQQQIAFAGNGTFVLKDVTLYEKPTFSIVDALVYDTAYINGYFSVVLNIPNFNYYGTCMMIMGKDSMLTLQNPLSYEFVDLFTPDVRLGIMRTYRKIRYPTGTRFFVKFYPYNHHGYGVYFDVRLNRNVYTGFGTPCLAIRSIVVP